MGKKSNKIISITPSPKLKYKSISKKIHNKYANEYTDKNNNIIIPKLILILVKHFKPKKNDYYRRHVKYTEMDFIKGIINIIENNMYWRRYNGKVPGKYLNTIHNLYAKWGVYHCLYILLLETYFSKKKFEKLKNQSVDTTFCINLYGKECYGRNVKYKSKNGIKISALTDTNGIPISLALASGNVHDSTIAVEAHISKGLIDRETKKVKNNNKFKQNFFADAAYFSKKIYEPLEKKGYNVITDVNIRNTKNKEKLEKMKEIKKNYLKRGKKRFVVEQFNAWIMKFPKIMRVVEKTIKSFEGLVLLACSLIIKNKIT